MYWPKKTKTFNWREKINLLVDTVQVFNFAARGNFALFFPTGMLTSKLVLQKMKGVEV
jgi:hypothetical protein